MPLTIKPASGSGSMTLISVAGTTTNDTLTLPAKTGNVITSADSGTVTGTMLASATVAGSNLTTGGPTWNSNGAVALLNGVTNATGTGITFPATQSASSDVNTLDDYEEGTWDPTITSTGTAPTSITYAYRRGSYVKIGRLVYISITLGATWGNTPTGDFRVINLPFSCVDAAGGYPALSIGWVNGAWSYGTSKTFVGCEVYNTTIDFSGMGSGVSTNVLTIGTNVSNGFFVQLTGTYTSAT